MAALAAMVAKLVIAIPTAIAVRRGWSVVKIIAITALATPIPPPGTIPVFPLGQCVEKLAIYPTSCKPFSLR